ncbi:putative calcium/sodium:proton antiporter [Roseovarius sp. A-2]|nr:putative calcium/sodium:proton antiporter [Roseovarius sp. A-2]
MHTCDGGATHRPGETGILGYLYLLAGQGTLFIGGEALVSGSVGIARRLSIPPLLIGLTVVGFSTSTPEFLVSVDAA